MKIDLFVKSFHRALPLSLVGIVGYSAYSYCYVYAYKTVYTRHSHGSGIALIALFCAFAFLVLIDWSLILLVGPGRVSKTHSYILSKDTDSFDNAVEPPPAFMSDPDGYPLWCSTCQHIKPDRVHHSAELGYCVDKMDHLCNWLGTVIGRQNFRYFMLLQIHFFSAIALVLSSVPVYIRDLFKHQRNGDHAHVIVLLSIAGFWACILIPFFLTHLKYVLQNTTTLEQIKYYKTTALRPIFNITLPQWAADQLHIGATPTDPKRIVSRIHFSDPRPYDRGSAWLNWSEAMSTNPLLWVLPIPSTRVLNRFVYFMRQKLRLPLPDTPPSFVDSSEYYLPQKIYINPKFTDLAVRRFLKNEEGFFAYPHLQHIPPEVLQHGNQRTHIRNSPQLSYATSYAQQHSLADQPVAVVPSITSLPSPDPSKSYNSPDTQNTADSFIAMKQV